jgi:putative transposase
MKRKRHTEE